ncbi:chromate efflux transporter [Acinetobacter tianfuensis]|uniref:Chromate efflux transporter n=1 Tax=Acinetobacter tianfuensis TaxID=2419603 RepID=A0A3A8EIB6_9GAMM|nr:chromate efflux transporter [Acinetobacter tianfuensis]RKG34682.1 chromate efflux transporter [Acinetobacter tianfuensis]
MHDLPSQQPNTAGHELSLLHLFIIFFQLGCTAFGGPAAHLVIFYQYFVQHKKWLSEQQYAYLLSLAQVLPGPSSSQLGISIGYTLKGYWGGAAAWLGFTLPSVLLMTLTAVLGIQVFDALDPAFFHVIQLLVLSVAAWAFWQMMQSFCQNIGHYALMLAAALFVYIVQLPINQILVIVLAALCGLFFSKKPALDQEKNTQYKSPENPAALQKSNHTRWAFIWLILFALPFLYFALFDTESSPLLYAVESFYRTSSLVFGGGHIILPFLHQDFVSNGMLSGASFNAGYAFAQLMPGPLFSFASYIGALLPMTPSLTLNAAISAIAIFLPSFLLLYGLLPYWAKLMQSQLLFKAVSTINAAVTGLLLCLIVQMGEKYIVQWLDWLFTAAVILLLKSKLPVWLSLIASGAAYYSLLHALN